MKNIITLLVLLITLSSFSQQLRLNEVDEFTGKTKKISKFYFAGPQLKTAFGRINSTVFLQVKQTNENIDLGCAGAHDGYVIILFIDGTSIKLMDKADIDCRDNSASVFYVTDELKMELLRNTVKKIRFFQGDFYQDYTPYGTYSLRQQINTVIN